jgi:dipeptidyl aminopeptidase/acylaminoacyl peptidase
MKIYFLACLLFSASFAVAQKTLTPLTVEKIMRDQKWIGSSPSNPYWSADGRYLLFSWNPENNSSDSIYYISLSDRTPRKATVALRQDIPSFNNIVYNKAKTAFAYAKDGDLFYVDAQKKEQRITQTAETESSVQFIEADTKIIFSRAQNLFSWNIAGGQIIQLTNFVRGTAPREGLLNTQEKWLQQNAIATSKVLQERKAKRESTEAYNKKTKAKELRSIYIEDKNIFGITASPDGRFISYRLTKPAANLKNTIIPNYVTESGYTTDISGRTNVGAPLASNEFFIFDREVDTVLIIKADAIPGLTDATDFSNALKDTSKKKASGRTVSFRGPLWNEQGTKAVVEVRSADNKDRWIMLLDAAKGSLKNIDRQRDEAWIAGPGTFSLPVWVNENTIVFQSEATGYSHIYKADVNTGLKTPLTSGVFEVSNLQLSKDKKYLYFNTNELHPGDYQFYRMAVSGGKKEQLTSVTGINTVTLSPDEKNLAILYSYSNKPPELYIQENKTGAKWQQLTTLAQSEEFKSYAWRDPEIVTFTAKDGATVYARLYKPANPHPSKPAAIFVHGAGYLQNVHKGWSSYSREYMFHNLLADNGYTVLDIDYRGSAGYGRDWRTGIYRYMGGKDLSDHIDGAEYLVKNHGVNPKNMGIYGGSYGGFITLMAMFTQPDVFKAGAALRSVTDWAHYNHGYTSNILNEPFTDSVAYKKSSPIYYAEGLKGHLLMCHGMVDVNVHFQDIVRLTQRLIELEKDNWELAVYPMEDHGFVEPSSWIDEYKRIFKLFERTLKQ